MSDFFQKMHVDAFLVRLKEFYEKEGLIIDASSHGCDNEISYTVRRFVKEEFELKFMGVGFDNDILDKESDLKKFKTTVALKKEEEEGFINLLSDPNSIQGKEIINEIVYLYFWLNNDEIRTLISKGYCVITDLWVYHGSSKRF